MIFADLTIKGMSGEALCSALKANAETRQHPVRRRLRRPRHRRKGARNAAPTTTWANLSNSTDLIRLVEKYARTQS